VWLCKTVGGTTVRWSGMTPRLQEHEFRARTIYGLMDDTSIIDWPLTLAELAPYYDRAELKMGVAGAHGVPPFPETNNFKVLKAGAQRLGYTQIDTRSVAINSVARDGRPGCQFLGFCHSGCASQAKWSTLYTEIAKAEDTDHFELRAQCMAVRIEHDAAGRVTSVVYRDAQGNTHSQKARAVAVAGNAIETTRLLLMSNSTRFPQGLANDSGHVGRNYMRHTQAFVHALMPGPVNYHRAPRQAGMVRDEHRHDPARGFAGGYLLQTAAFPPGNIAAEISGWGEDAARIMEKYTHFAGMFIVGEDPPQAKNRIALHPTDVDENRLPVPVIEYEDHPNSVVLRRHAVARGKAIYESLGATWVAGTDGVGVTCHNMGTARMSANPADGVTNRWGQAHDVPNLFVSDGSVFTSSGAPNPTLTIVSLAIRQADHIARRMSRGEL
jgi:choline dehydrogenase-like flavoprotein